jgi:transcriptional regulator with GAF, ATPase, and Fis domain
MILVHQKLILLTALVAMLLAFLKIKSGNHIFNSRALRLMSYGIILLIVGSAVGLIGSSGIFGPGYSQSMIYFVLESIIGYIAGWALLIWGIAEWLPYMFSLSNRLHNETRRSKLYESILKVSSYGGASPTTFKRIASSLIENYNYQAASLHIPDKTGSLSLFCALGLTRESKSLIDVVEGSIYNKAYDTGDVYQIDESIKVHKDAILKTDSGPVADALAVPVEFGTNRVGVMTVYTDHLHVFKHDERNVLDAVSANLGLAFYKDGLQKSINAGKSFKDFIAVILKTSRSEDNFNTKVIRLAKLLKLYANYNLMHLYLIGDGAPQVLDFDLAGGSRLVVEKGFLTGDDYKPVRWVMNHKRSLVLPDELEIFGHAWKSSKDSRMLYTPVVVNGDVVGVLGLCVALSRKIDLNDKIVCDAISSVVSGSLLEEMNRNLNEDTCDRIGAIKYSIESALTGNPSNRVYRELARIIVEKTPATFCRIMLMNPGRDRLLTAAIYQRRHLSWDENTIASVPVSELYTHRKVMSTGKPILIKQIDSRLKISEMEKKLLLPQGISQCMINPIIIGGKIQGVVTIGENRRPERNRIGSNETIYALLLTNVISMVLMQNAQALRHKRLVSTNRLTVRKLAGLRNQAQTFGVINDFNSRLNGPLASILASCELMNSNPELTKSQIKKYINVIDRNAQRIHKLSGQFSEAKRSLEIIDGN